MTLQNRGGQGGRGGGGVVVGDEVSHIFNHSRDTNYIYFYQRLQFKI